MGVDPNRAAGVGPSVVGVEGGTVMAVGVLLLAGGLAGGPVTGMERVLEGGT